MSIMLSVPMYRLMLAQYTSVHTGYIHVYVPDSQLATEMQFINSKENICKQLVVCRLIYSTCNDFQYYV